MSAEGSVEQWWSHDRDDLGIRRPEAQVHPFTHPPDHSVPVSPSVEGMIVQPADPWEHPVSSHACLWGGFSSEQRQGDGGEGQGVGGGPSGMGS